MKAAARLVAHPWPSILPELAALLGALKGVA